MGSIWSKEVDIKEREPLQGEITVDVAVIGGGMAGILIASLLQEKGINVVVLEADRIGSGVTQNTTAKITSQHHLIYAKLVKYFGSELAGQYALCNENAIKKYTQMIKGKNIACDFETKDAYVYSTGDTRSIMEETDAAKRLGIDAEFTTKTCLPLDISGAVKFKGQAQFHPLKFLAAISKELKIYENTMVGNINGDTITTENGKVHAKHKVVATHYPFINVPGYYFLRMHQDRSYVIMLSNAAQIDGMYIDVYNDGYSFRNYNDHLLLGGGSRRTGTNCTADTFNMLRKAAKDFYPQSIEVSNWATQDCMTQDSVPYIGKYSSIIPNLYVATGFNKWGMTSSMVSAMVLSDMIAGNNTDYAKVFSSQRFNTPAQLKNLLADVTHSVIGLTGGVLSTPEKKCTHLGCRLKYNGPEEIWECPCHGSTFDKNGLLINNPAMVKKQV